MPSLKRVTPRHPRCRFVLAAAAQRVLCECQALETRRLFADLNFPTNSSAKERVYVTDNGLQIQIHYEVFDQNSQSFNAFDFTFNGADVDRIVIGDPSAPNLAYGDLIQVVTTTTHDVTVFAVDGDQVLVGRGGNNSLVNDIQSTVYVNGMGVETTLLNERGGEGHVDYRLQTTGLEWNAGIAQLDGRIFFGHGTTVRFQYPAFTPINDTWTINGSFAWNFDIIGQLPLVTYTDTYSTAQNDLYLNQYVFFDGATKYGTDASWQIDAGGGNDKIDVTAPLHPFTFHGGAGADRMNVDDNGVAGSFIGDAGDDTLSYSGSDTLADSFAIDASAILHTNLSNNHVDGALSYEAEHVSISGSGGDDVFRLAALPSTTAVTVNSGAGADRFILADDGVGGVRGPVNFIGDGDDDFDYFNPSSHAFHYTITTTTIAADDLVNGDVDPLITFSANHTTLTLGSGADQVRVRSYIGATAATINGGGGDDLLLISGNDGSTSDINGLITFNGEGGTDTLDYDDRASGSAHTYGVLSGSLTRNGAGGTNFDTIESVYVRAGGAADTIRVGTLQVPTTLQAGGGDDDVQIGTSFHNLRLIAAPLFVDAGAGANDAITLDDTFGSEQDYVFAGSTLTATGVATITYAAVEAAALLGGPTAQNFYVRSAAIPLTLSGGAGDDQFIIGNNGQVNLINSPVSIIGEGGNDLLKYDNSSTLAGNNYLLTSSAITQGGNLNIAAVNFDATVDQIDFRGSTGGDLLNVQSTRAFQNVTVSGGDGNDTISLGAGTDNLVLINNGLSIVGGAGTDLLQIRNSSVNLPSITHLHETVFTVDGITVNFAALEALSLTTSATTACDVYVDGTDAATHVTINSGAGNDRYFFGNTFTKVDSIAASVSINGGAGTDSISYQDLNNGAAASTYTLDAAKLGRSGQADVNFNAVEAINVAGTYLGATWMIIGAAATASITLQGGSGDDTFRVGTAAGSVAGIAVGAKVSIDGGSATDALIYDDHANDFATGAPQYTLSDLAVTRTSSGTINYSSIDSLAVSGGVDNNEFFLNATRYDMATTVNGGIGDDKFYTAQASQNATDLAGPTTVNGGIGDDRIIYQDQAETNGYYFTISPTSIKRQLAAKLNHVGVENLQINSGGASTMFLIESVAAGETLTIAAGAGDDRFRLASDENGYPASLAGFVGALTLDGGDGTDEIDFSDFLSTDNPSGIKLTDTAFSRSGITTINYGAVERATLTAGTGDDAITVRPSTATLFTINGGGSSGVGNRLLIDASDAQGQTLAGSSGNGTLTYSNRQPIAIQNFVSIAVADITPPAVLTAIYDYNAVVPGVALTFSESVASFASSAFKLVNLTTGATIVPSSIALSGNGATRRMSFPGFTNGVLPDGNYRITFFAGVVQDLAGNALSATPTFDFFVLAGDANHDRNVNFDDLVILAQNYNKTGLRFSDGNFDYSSDGGVNFDDLVILAQRYNTTLAAALLAPVASATKAPVATTKKAGPAAGRIAELS